MLGMTRWNSVDDFFTFQRQLESVFDLPGIDPRNVNLDVAGHTLTIRAEQPASGDAGAGRYEQSFTVPQFLDVEKISASYRYGMLQLALPLKESVKPRRINIAGVTDQKQIASAA